MRPARRKGWRVRRCRGPVANELLNITGIKASLYLPGLPAITPDSLLSLRKTMFGFTDETELDILGNFITSETWHEVECVMRSGSGSGKGEELFANPEVLAILSRYHDTQRDLF